MIGRNDHVKLRYSTDEEMNIWFLLYPLCSRMLKALPPNACKHANIRAENSSTYGECYILQIYVEHTEVILADRRTWLEIFALGNNAMELHHAILTQKNE